MATDPDATAVLQNWQITGGNTGDAFEIVAATGQIRVLTMAALDIETTPVFNLTVTVSDGTHTSAVETININLTDVNEFTPVVTGGQSFNVDENSANSTVVGTVLASDQDANSVLQSFTITGGNTNNAFAISSSTGVITVADSNELDTETTPSYTLQVTVSDGTNTSTAENVVITVNDVNDNAPVVDADQMFAIDENLANMSVVGTLTAQDADSTAVLSGWNIVSGNTGGAFALNAASGQLTVANSNALDREMVATFTLMVTVSDGTNTSAQQAVTVNLNDVNEFTPVVDGGQSFSIAENSAAMTNVGIATASDQDATAVLQNWMITGGNTGDAFAINPATGQISVQTMGALDAETNPVFNLTLTVSDGTNTSAAQTVVVTLNDVNEFTPVVTPGQSFTIDEDEKNGDAVGTVLATDADVTSVFQDFTITSGNTGGAFTINANSGQIRIANETQVDFETTPTFTLQVTVSDGTNTSAAQNVVINLNDLNDNDPTVDAGQTFGLDENTANGTTVGTLTASDADANLVFSGWTITGGNTGGAFSIDPMTGQVDVADQNALNFEVSPSFTLQVTVSDGMNTSAAQNVTVNLNDLAESFTIDNRAFNPDPNVTIKRTGNLLRATNSMDVDVVPPMVFASVIDIQITTSNAPDTLRVDFAGGDPIPASGLSVTNIGESADQFIFGTNSGMTFSSVSHLLVSSLEGQFDFDGKTVDYDGFRLRDALPATTRSFGLSPDNAVGLTLLDNGATNDDFSLLHASDGSEISFVHPAMLFLAGEDGDDSITLGTVDAQFDSVLSIDGRDGNDVIDGSAFNVFGGGATPGFNVQGGVGNDTIIDGPGPDMIDGGSGDDDLTAILGNNSVTGGANNDTVTTSVEGDQTIVGGTGVNTLNLADTMTGDLAYTFSGNASATIVATGAGPMTVIGYSDFGTVDDQVSTTSRHFNLDNLAQTVQILPGQLQSPTIGNISFANPTASLTVMGGTNDDVFEVLGIDNQLQAAIAIIGGAGNDTTQLAGGLTRMGAGGDLSIDTETIEIGGDVSLLNGNLTLTGMTNVTNATSFQANLIDISDVQTGGEFNLQFIGVSTIGNINVIGTAQFTGDATVSGTAFFGGLAQFSGAVELAQADLSGPVQLNGNSAIFNGPTIVRDMVQGSSAVLDVRGDLQLADGQVAVPAGINIGVQQVIPPTVTVSGNGILTSNSTTVRAGGVVAPGLSPGSIQTGNIAFQAGSTFTVELTGPAAGTQYDQLVVTGTVDLGGATLNVSLEYDATNENFVIVDNDGTDAISGTFANLAEGTSFDLVFNSLTGSIVRRYVITYQGGDGNDVVLFAVGAITGQVFDDDSNGNGLNEPADAAVMGVAVELLSEDRIFVASTTTGVDGRYQFSDLLPDTFRVRFTAPDGRHFTARKVGEDNTVDSDANQLTGFTPPVDVLPGITFTGLDAGLITTRISILNAVPVQEGSSGLTTPVSFTVVLNGRSPHVVTAVAQAFEGNDGTGLNQATLGTGVSQDDDFAQFGSGQQAISFQPGQTELTISLSAFGDGTIEPTEAFEARLLTATQALILDGVARGTILNDDVATPTLLLVPNPVVTEGQFPNTTALNFKVQLLGGAIDEDIVFNFTTVDPVPGFGMPGVATPNVDYTPVSGQITLFAGQTTITIPVEIKGDNQPESDENVVLRLTSVNAGASGAVLGNTIQVVGTIRDDDFVIPTVSIADASVLESSAPNTPVLEFPVTLSGPAQTDTIISFRSLTLSSAGTATPLQGTFDSRTTEDFIPKQNQIVIPAGQTSGTIRIGVFGDSDIESDEVVGVELVELISGNATLGTTLAVGTIINDDFLIPTLAFGTSPSTSEGRVLQRDELEFEIQLNGPATEDIVVFVSTLDIVEPGSATAGIDYIPFANRPVFIPRGVISATVSVTIIGDEIPETDELVRLQIVNMQPAGGIPINLDATRSQVSGTIENDDGVQPTLFLDSVTTVQELDAPFTSVAEIVVQLDTFSPGIVTVDLEVIDPVTGAAVSPNGMISPIPVGLATPGMDFNASSGTVTFAPGQTTAIFQVLINGDEEVEPPEDFFVRIAGFTGNVTLDTFRDHTTATITDNDNVAAVVSIESTTTVNELDNDRRSTAFLEVSIDSAINQDVTVFVSTPPAAVDNYSTAGVDFIPLVNEPIIIRAGEMTATVPIVVLGDNLDENDETFIVRINSVTNGVIALDAREATVTIRDNDKAFPVAFISDARVEEGDSDDDVDLVFVVTIEGRLDERVSVEVQTVRADQLVPGLANSDGPPDDRDFFRTRRILHFDPTVTVQEFRVRVIPDARFEPDEILFATLFNPQGIGLAPGNSQATGTIINDDFERPTLSISGASVLEGDFPGQSILSFTVMLDADPEMANPIDGQLEVLDIEVDFRTIDVTAIAGIDYTPVQGTLLFTDGQRSQTIEVPVIGNVTDEVLKRLIVELSNPKNAGFDKAAFQGEGQIQNDDSPSIRFQVDSVSDFESRTDSSTFDFTVTMIGKSPNPVTVDFATQDDTAIAGEDYTATSGTLTFLPGGLAQQIVSVTINNDMVEDSEFEAFLLNLSNASEGEPDPEFAQGIGIIQDDDARVPRARGDQAFANVTVPSQLELLKDAIDRNDEAEVIRIQRVILNDAGLTSGLVFFGDPVDLLLTDLESRTTGYSNATGEVTENARAYYSGDGANELIIIPEAAAGVYDLALSSVGTGEYRTAATLFSADGSAKTITNTGVLSGDLQLSLDFTTDTTAIPAQSNVVSELADALAGRNEEETGDLDQLAIALKAAQAAAEFQKANDEQSAGEIFQAAWRAVADTLGSMSSILQDGLASVLSPETDPDDPDKKDKSDDEPTLDDFFKDLGKSLLGAPGAIFDLDLFDLLDQNEKDDSEENGEDEAEEKAEDNAQNENDQNGERNAENQTDQRRKDGKDDSTVQARLEIEAQRGALLDKEAKQKADRTKDRENANRRVVLRRTYPKQKTAPAFIEDLAKLMGQNAQISAEDQVIRRRRSAND
jgi:hypothetical protein